MAAIGIPELPYSEVTRRRAARAEPPGGARGRASGRWRRVDRVRPRALLPGRAAQHREHLGTRGPRERHRRSCATRSPTTSARPPTAPSAWCSRVPTGAPTSVAWARPCRPKRSGTTAPGARSRGPTPPLASRSSTSPTGWSRTRSGRPGARPRSRAERPTAPPLRDPGPRVPLSGHSARATIWSLRTGIHRGEA